MYTIIKCFRSNGNDYRFLFGSAGQYYGQGYVAIYNGNGYNTYITNKSPYVTLSEIEYDVNENGEIYGSKYFLNAIGVEPDLISATGDDGTEGYIKRVDLEIDEASTLEEALATNYNTRTVPLYTYDGKTIVGQFTFSN